MLLDQFLGNFNTVKALSDWLDGWYHSANHKPPYALLYGQSGNGKTFLIKLLADTFDVDLHIIDADNIREKEDMDLVVKSLNLTKLNGKESKLVLVENYDEILYKGQLFDFYKICDYPIIYTTCKYPKTDVEFKNGGLYLKLEKPRTSQLVELMQIRCQKLGIQVDESKLEQIAKKSVSVRAALNSCFTLLSNESLEAYVSIYEKIKSLSNRGLSQDIQYPDLISFYRALQGYGEDEFLIRLRFCWFDFMFKGMWKETVDAFLVNKMREPLEKVEFEYQKKNGFKKESKVEKKKEPERVATIESWF
jgi:hypothetical protein